MKVAHILFSASMVRALVAGNKTQTRRMAKPRWGEGDLLCVREAFRLPVGYDARPPLAWAEDVARMPKALNPVHYEADGKLTKIALGGVLPGKLRPSIHMPRLASRLTLRVQEVRQQRLRAISSADAWAEGITVLGEMRSDEDLHFGVEGMAIDEPSAPRAYFALWNAINGAGAAEADPLIWVTRFEVIRANVDAVLEGQA